jgi:hypothetical protein
MLTFESGQKTEESWLLKRRLLAPNHIASRSVALARRS